MALLRSDGEAITVKLDIEPVEKPPHRRFTFRLTTPPSRAEFLRYVGVQSTIALINYGIFVMVVVLRPDIEPLLALVISSGVAMVFSYFGIRYAAFRHGIRPSGSDTNGVGSRE